MAHCILNTINCILCEGLSGGRPGAEASSSRDKQIDWPRFKRLAAAIRRRDCTSGLVFDSISGRLMRKPVLAGAAPSSQFGRYARTSLKSSSGRPAALAQRAPNGIRLGTSRPDDIWPARRQKWASLKAIKRTRLPAGRASDDDEKSTFASGSFSISAGRRRLPALKRFGSSARPCVWSSVQFITAAEWRAPAHRVEMLAPIVSPKWRAARKQLACVVSTG
jgi:hypothetical protein